MAIISLFPSNFRPFDCIAPQNISDRLSELIFSKKYRSISSNNSDNSIAGDAHPLSSVKITLITKFFSDFLTILGVFRSIFGPRNCYFSSNVCMHTVNWILISN